MVSIPRPVDDPDLHRPGRLERMGGFDVDGLACAATQIDYAVANGSSIAVLARWGDHSCLTTGDAHADVMIMAIDRLVGPAGVLSVDVFKVPHHGSKSNVTTELMKRIDAKVYVFSSNGPGTFAASNDEAVRVSSSTRWVTAAWRSTIATPARRRGRPLSCPRPVATERCTRMPSTAASLDLMQL